MTDQRSALDRTLDVVLFAPLGLAVTIVDELPELAGKGRARLSQRASTARLVGQFAVAEGRRRLRARSSPGTPPPTRFPPASGLHAVAPEPDDPGRPLGSPTGPGHPGRPATRPVTATGRPLDSGPGGTSAEGNVPVAGDGSTGRGDYPARPESGELAIPGYDSLSASQVVQRLASLSSAELEAVRGYEATTRGRRTILARVAQLQRG
jgi:hypothetical protein